MPEVVPSNLDDYPGEDGVRDIAEMSWCRVLGVPAVAGDDDFFELGGDSILATRIASYLKRELAIEVDILLIWEASRFADFQAALAAITSQAGTPEGAEYQ
jgi:acyl carrier protein